MDVTFEVTLNDFHARLTFNAPRSIDVAPLTLNFNVVVVLLRVDEETNTRLETLTPGVRLARAEVRAP